MPRFVSLVGLVGLGFIALATAVVGCAGVRAPSGSGSAGGTGHQSADAAVGTGGRGVHVVGAGGAYDASLPPIDAPMPITDFPPDPIIAPGAPPSAPTLFGTAGRAGGAPCIMSPEPGTLMPRNWLRPRFEYTPTADENLFEITLTVPSFTHHLVIYTTARSYTLDANIWDGLRVSVNDQPVVLEGNAVGLWPACAAVLDRSGQALMPTAPCEPSAVSPQSIPSEIELANPRRWTKLLPVEGGVS